MLPIEPGIRTCSIRATFLLIVAILGAAPQRADGQVREIMADRREIQIDVRLRGFNRTVLLDTLAVWTPVTQSPTAALADARFVLDSLKVPVSNFDSLARVVYNNGFTARTALAGRNMSAFLRCGWGMTGDHADSWRISLGYAVYVKPAKSGGSSLGVAIVGSAADIEGAAKPVVQCASTGGFEQMIAKAVAARALAPSP